MIYSRGFPTLLAAMLCVFAGAAAMSVSRPASANEAVYTLALYTGSGTPPAAPYATVTLNDHGGPNVGVTLRLALGEGLVNTGAGAALTWMLRGDPVATITGLNTTDFAISHDGTSTGNLDGTGTWMYEIDCTTAGCGHGGSLPYTSPLTFTVDNVTIAGFVSNNKTDDGYYFASDICTELATPGGCSGITGNVASDTYNLLTTSGGRRVPEPASMALLGVGMLALSLVRARSAARPLGCLAPSRGDGGGLRPPPARRDGADKTGIGTERKAL